MMLVRYLGIFLLVLTIALRIVQLADAVRNVPYHDDGRTVFTRFEKVDRVWQVKTEGEVYFEMNEKGDVEIHCWNREGRRVNIIILREEMEKQLKERLFCGPCYKWRLLSVGDDHSLKKSDLYSL